MCVCVCVCVVCCVLCVVCCVVTENKSYTLTVMREEVVWVWDCERKIERNQ